MLYPKNTQTRTCISLNGIWNFALVPEGETYTASEPLKNGRPMPVPCAYNDIYEGREIREHVGIVVYEREIESVPAENGERFLLHFGSVAHRCQVYWNGVRLGAHSGGFLPFSFDVTGHVRRGHNRLTVLADNRVDHTTLPCGTVQERRAPGIPARQLDLPNFDFFNYGGILRPVSLYRVPGTHIESIRVFGTMDGVMHYEVTAFGTGDCAVSVWDGERLLWEGEGFQGEAVFSNITPWCPETPKLYALEVVLRDVGGGEDRYTEWFGFRTVDVRSCGLYLNGKKIYLKGFGKHEDVPVIGRGFCEPYQVKDLALMKWMGANSFRTSHYPYSEEMMQLCDRMGILVIDEAPAVGMHTTFTATGMRVDVTSPTWETLQTQDHHRDVLREMIARDENHPSVIAWSVANEPASEEPGAYGYFKPLFELVRELDPQHRPVTFATHGEATVETCEVAALCDILMLNRYYGWYSQEGDLPAARAILSDELDRYHARYPDKPVMLGEFGADAVAGLHDTTAQMFSEEYQKDMIAAYCAVLDEKPYVFGEHVWNFADFATAESVKRVQGNKKGVFTRDRKPKLAAWYLKSRWKTCCDGEPETGAEYLPHWSGRGER